MDSMAPRDSLAGIVTARLDTLGLSIADGARVTGISYRELHRIVRNRVQLIRPATLARLELLGLARRELAVAAYGTNGESPPVT